ncbi:ScbA/BarX family gamma-butyrolactone biosynthesis protein [Streptomyces sp. NPDC059649]|uniref:ScbA/BarX family gamma-butyrolactone biosynthesis protein n=1 Tax=Streptomyces sp. NPDC059649 TaxID=3346895 RepID=UPI003684F3E1
MPEAAIRIRPLPHDRGSPGPVLRVLDAQSGANAVGSSAVPREFTHLRDAERVFITGWNRCGPGAFSLTGRWPAAHGDGRADPRVLAQTFRQSGLTIAHAEYGVPLSHHMILHDLSFTANPKFRVSDSGPTDLGIEVAVSQTRRSGRCTSALGMVVRIHQDDVTVAQAESEFAWSSPAVYRRLRGERLGIGWGSWPVPAPVAPALVGRTDAAEVMLSPGGRPRRWRLRNDTGNTLLFDHPVDHVPGLALLEAAYQAAHATVAPARFTPATVISTYERYVEFDEPCWIEAQLLPRTPSGRLTVLVTGTQGGRTVFRAGLSGAPCQSAGSRWLTD